MEYGPFSSMIYSSKMVISIAMWNYHALYAILSKEVGKQYFRVTNDFYLMELTMMKGGT